MTNVGQQSHGNNMSGFTLIQLMLVTIIRTIPRARVAQALLSAAALEAQIAQYYDRWRRLPTDNAAAGLPQPNAIRGRGRGRGRLGAAKRFNLFLKVGEMMNDAATALLLFVNAAAAGGRRQPPTGTAVMGMQVG